MTVALFEATGPPPSRPYIYAAAFSFAYNTLSAGTGALLLFGAVQATMILWGLRKGESLHARQLIGLALALTGLVVLVYPGLFLTNPSTLNSQPSSSYPSSPPLRGSILMLGAGIAWGIYSLRGKGEKNPANATAGNFLRAVPFAVVVSIITISQTHLDSLGVGYAVLSGAITSGVGYVLWYSVLPDLSATSAATVQLSVPVLAAMGGILLLGEPLTLRFLLASVAVLGGIALVVIKRRGNESEIHSPRNRDGNVKTNPRRSRVHGHNGNSIDISKFGKTAVT